MATRQGVAGGAAGLLRKPTGKRGKVIATGFGGGVGGRGGSRRKRWGGGRVEGVGGRGVKEGREEGDHS